MKNIALLGRITSLERFKSLANVLKTREIKATPVIYDDGVVKEVEEELRDNYDGVICWVDPVSSNATGEEESRVDCTGNNSGLDQILRQLAAKEIHVSAHPDIIEKMGTKKVLFDTRNEPWGLPTTLYYKTKNDLHENLQKSLSSEKSKCRVLKMERGSGGRGVWRCDVIESDQDSIDGDTMLLRVQHAGDDAIEEAVPLETMLNRLEERMTKTGGGIVDMPFLPRVSEGLVRCYMFRDRCAGILHQLPINASDVVFDIKSLSRPNLNVSHSKQFQTKGLPEGKRVHPPNSPVYLDLVQTLETDWIPRLVEAVGLLPVGTMSSSSVHNVLPVVWDIDFIHRSPGDEENSNLQTGEQIKSKIPGYVLCEINCSCVFPSELMDEMADEIAAWVKYWK